MKLHPSVISPLDRSFDLSVLPVRKRLSVMFGGRFNMTIVCLGLCIAIGVALMLIPSVQRWAIGIGIIPHEFTVFARICGVCLGLFVAMVPGLFGDPDRLIEAFSDPRYHHGILNPEFRKLGR